MTKKMSPQHVKSLQPTVSPSHTVNTFSLKKRKSAPFIKTGTYLADIRLVAFYNCHICEVWSGLMAVPGCRVQPGPYDRVSMLLQTVTRLITPSTACQYHTLHCTALHCTALHCTALHCTALHCTALHFTALYYSALHCTALPCPALPCTALY